MSILGCVFALIMICFSANCKHKNVFLQRTSTKTILTKKENFRELQVLEWAEKCTFWKRKKRNGEKRAKRFLGRSFRALKYVDFRFRTIKNKENRDDCAILQMYIFFGRCTFVMCILGAGCLMYWSEAVRSVPGATSEARREKRRFTKVSKQSLDLVQC